MVPLGLIVFCKGLPRNFPIPSNTSGNISMNCSFLVINQLSLGMDTVVGFSLMWWIIGLCVFVLLG